MMTMALKDSLGGNCRTVMVATMSSVKEQLDESISTCRFAQRVAMVRNQVGLGQGSSSSESIGSCQIWDHDNDPEQTLVQ